MIQPQSVSYKGDSTGFSGEKKFFSNEGDSHKCRMLFILLDLSFTWGNDRLKCETLSPRTRPPWYYEDDSPESTGYWELGRQNESESEVAQPCPTLCDPMDCSLPGSSTHEIFEARLLEWVAISFSRGSSQPRDRTRVSRVAGRLRW